MERRNYIACITINGEEIASQTKYAWNSAIRATEALVRAYARGTGTLFTGDKPTILDRDARDRHYLRHWTNPAGITITAGVWETY